jgi:hypothetical protein
MQTNDHHQTLVDVDWKVLDLHQCDGHFVEVDLRATAGKKFEATLLSSMAFLVARRFPRAGLGV